MRAVVALAAVLLLCSPAVAVDLPPLSVDPNGGAAGGDALYIPRGDILNVRNIQGGTPGDPSLDIAAGDAAHHGRTVVNWDLGKSFDIYAGYRADGTHKLLARFDRRGITFYVRPHYAKKP